MIRIAVWLALLFWLGLNCGAVFARDFGQFNGNSEIKQWYQGLMQPDNPAVGCCGESDAYWADSFEVSPNGEYVAIVTDERPDEPLKRRHVEPGTRIVVPNHKIKFGPNDPQPPSNPTGHAASGGLYVVVSLLGKASGLPRYSAIIRR